MEGSAMQVEMAFAKIMPRTTIIKVPVGTSLQLPLSESGVSVECVRLMAGVFILRRHT
jgi:hypothetical protein